MNKAIIFSILTLAILGLFLSQEAQAGNGVTPPLCPLGTTLTLSTLNGVPLCAVEASCPPNTTPDILGICQPGEVTPSCPPNTNLDSGICTALSTCPSGTTLNTNSLLCELTGPPIVTPVIGGTIIPIDMTILFITGAMTNAFWMVPTIGGIAGSAIALFKVTRKSA